MGAYLKKKIPTGSSRAKSLSFAETKIYGSDSSPTQIPIPARLAMTNSTLRNLLGSADPARSFAVLIRPIRPFPSAGPLAHEVPSDALSNLSSQLSALSLFWRGSHLSSGDLWCSTKFSTDFPIVKKNVVVFTAVGTADDDNGNNEVAIVDICTLDNSTLQTFGNKCSSSKCSSRKSSSSECSSSKCSSSNKQSL